MINMMLFSVGKKLCLQALQLKGARARASTGLREKVPPYGLSRGTDSTAPLADMNYMKC